MKSYLVEVTIQNKPLAQDPEGDTILKNLVNKGGYKMVTRIRSGKYLQLHIDAASSQQAAQAAEKMCNELRIFNPVVHTCSIKVGGELQ